MAKQKETKTGSPNTKNRVATKSRAANAKATRRKSKLGLVCPCGKTWDDKSNYLRHLMCVGTDSSRAGIESTGAGLLRCPPRSPCKVALRSMLTGCL